MRNAGESWRLPAISTPRGVEPLAESSGKAYESENGGAGGGAIEGDNAQFDADLATVIAAWPTLADDVKAGIVAMVKAAGGD